MTTQGSATEAELDSRILELQQCILRDLVDPATWACELMNKYCPMFVALSADLDRCQFGPAALDEFIDFTELIGFGGIEEHWEELLLIADSWGLPAAPAASATTFPEVAAVTDKDKLVGYPEPEERGKVQRIVDPSVVSADPVQISAATHLGGGVVEGGQDERKRKTSVVAGGLRAGTRKRTQMEEVGGDQLASGAADRDPQSPVRKKIRSCPESGTPEPMEVDESKEKPGTVSAKKEKPVGQRRRLKSKRFIDTEDEETGDEAPEGSLGTSSDGEDRHRIVHREMLQRRHLGRMDGVYDSEDEIPAPRESEAAGSHLLHGEDDEQSHDSKIFARTSRKLRMPLPSKKSLYPSFGKPAASAPSGSRKSDTSAKPSASAPKTVLVNAAEKTKVPRGWRLAAASCERCVQNNLECFQSNNAKVTVCHACKKEKKRCSLAASTEEDGWTRVERFALDRCLRLAHDVPDWHVTQMQVLAGNDSDITERQEYPELLQRLPPYVPVLLIEMDMLRQQNTDFRNDISCLSDIIEAQTKAIEGFQTEVRDMRTEMQATINANEALHADKAERQRMENADIQRKLDMVIQLAKR